MERGAGQAGARCDRPATVLAACWLLVVALLSGVGPWVARSADSMVIASLMQASRCGQPDQTDPALPVTSDDHACDGCCLLSLPTLPAQGLTTLTPPVFVIVTTSSGVVAALRRAVSSFHSARGPPDLT